MESLVEESQGWESAINPETARAVLGTMAASMFTFIVFVCSALLVAGVYAPCWRT